jgi:hypothetical protein
LLRMRDFSQFTSEENPQPFTPGFQHWRQAQFALAEAE